MRWLLKSRSPATEDLTGLLDPAWTGGKVTAVRSPGGAVTIHANSLARQEAASGTVPVLTLPDRYRPLEHVYGTSTHRGNRVRCLASGALSLDSANVSLDYFSVTYVPKGGA